MFVFGPAADLAIRLRENNKTKSNNSSSLSLSSILSPKISPSAEAEPPSEQSLSNYSIGERVGRYGTIFILLYIVGCVINSCLVDAHSGRWAVVYQATHRFSGIPVALKRVLKREDGVVQRFMLREKEAIKRVKGHKHVVDLYEVFEDAEFIYVVQEYLPGGTLRERIRRVCAVDSLESVCVRAIKI